MATSGIGAHGSGIQPLRSISTELNLCYISQLEIRTYVLFFCCITKLLVLIYKQSIRCHLISYPAPGRTNSGAYYVFLLDQSGLLSIQAYLVKISMIHLTSTSILFSFLRTSPQNFRTLFSNTRKQVAKGQYKPPGQNKSPQGHPQSLKSSVHVCLKERSKRSSLCQHLSAKKAPSTFITLFIAVSTSSRSLPMTMITASF